MGGWGPPPAAPKPGVIPLRPLGIPELLDGAITAVRRYPKAIIVPSFIVALGLGAINYLTALVSITMYRGINDLNPYSVTGSDLAGVFGPTLFVAFVGALIQLVATVLLTGVVTAVMGQAVLGKSVTLEDAWALVKPRVWKLLGLGLLVTVIITVGLIICLIPGLVAAVYLSIAAAALVLEKSTVGASLRRSMSLVNGAFWRTFGALILMAIIYFVINLAISVPFSIPEIVAPSVDSNTFTVNETRFVINNAIATVGSIIISTITLPFVAAVLALIYIDRRMRTEGLDITLARQSGGQ
ncbi:MAG: hypothetical protein ABI720_06340 [Actinomycetes bacterium]